MYALQSEKKYHTKSWLLEKVIALSRKEKKTICSIYLLSDLILGEGEKKDDKQFNFRNQRSTIDVLSKVTTKNGFRKQKMAIIFFNIKKVYDKVK